MTTAEVVRRPRGGLVRHRDFRWLWFGDTISQVGTQVTGIALPLVAVTTLHATTFQVGLLTACEFAAFLLVGLPAGAWVDRVRRRPVMIGTDLLRALLLGSLPVAAAAGVLTLYQLYAVALVHGICTVFFDVAYQSYLPSLVTRDELVEGNAKLQASQSVAQVGGPAFGGLLVGAFTAPYALVADAVSFVVSAGSIRRIGAAEPAPDRPEVPNLRREIGEGLRFVLRHPILRMIAGCTGTFNLFSGASGPIAVVFLVRDLGVSPGLLGVLFSAGSVGGILGALIAARVAHRIGSARASWVPLMVTGPLGLLTALSFAGPGLVLFAAGTFATSIGTVVYNVNQVSFRQALCPPRLLGRMNATMRFLVWGTLPIGGLLGGALGDAFGNRAALWVVVGGQAVAVVWVLASPLRRMRDLPPYEAVEEMLERTGEPAAPIEAG